MLDAELESGKRSASRGFQRLKESFGAQPKEKTFADEFNEQVCFSLSRKERLYGFAACFCVGWLIALMSVFAMGSITRKPARFALLYSIGNVVSLLSTCFLWGPWAQIKTMFKPIRAGATLMYLLMIGLTLFCAFKVKKAPLVLLCLALQCLAMIWYCASYIPYGRKMLLKMGESCMNMC